MCFSERGQAVGSRFIELFAMLSTLILNTSTIVDQDIHALRVGYSNHACFIKAMRMLWRNDVFAQLVDEHLDQLSLIKPINDADVSGLQRF